MMHGSPFSVHFRGNVRIVVLVLIEALVRPITAWSRQSGHRQFTLQIDDSALLTPPPDAENAYPPMVSTPSGPLLSKIIQPPNVEDLFEWYCYTAKTPDADPSWAVVWPTAVALVDHLLEHPEAVQDKRVMELGCGLGVAGLYASALGAASVTLTDREPFSLHCAMSTAAVNHLPQVKAAVLDWNSPLCDLEADVILASDVLYDSTAIQALADVCKKIAAPGATLLLTDPRQERCPDARNMLQKALRPNALAITSLEPVNSQGNSQQQFTTSDGKDHARRMQEQSVLVQCSIHE